MTISSAKLLKVPWTNLNEEISNAVVAKVKKNQKLTLQAVVSQDLVCLNVPV